MGIGSTPAVTATGAAKCSEPPPGTRIIGGFGLLFHITSSQLSPSVLARRSLPLGSLPSASSSLYLSGSSASSKSMRDAGGEVARPAGSCSADPDAGSRDADPDTREPRCRAGAGRPADGGGGDTVLSPKPIHFGS
jgi:hypothetical protein